MSDPDEVPRPPVLSFCQRCGVFPGEVFRNEVVVSPTGKAHAGSDGGVTGCGIDTTGVNYRNWWWPL